MSTLWKSPNDMREVHIILGKSFAQTMYKKLFHYLLDFSINTNK